MPQNRPYLYDPSQQIRKDLGSAADSVAQGFQNVLDSKILGYLSLIHISEPTRPY